MATRRVDQAVVVIHGIGEQRPMGTLRGFVEAVLPPRDDGEQYFSKPDPLAETFEVRKLQDRNQPRTHFFEYYWAYKVEGTVWAHLRQWLLTLLLRSPRRVPRHLIGLWAGSWALLLVVLVGTVVYARAAEGSVEAWRSGVAAAVAGVVFGTVQAVVLNYLGDAARYLSPHPKNIALRQSIRTEGVQLLRRLHESGQYERIVVVGHSLGSVIAYDVLKVLWEEQHRQYRSAREHEQPALHRLEALGATLPESPSYAQLDAFHRAQRDLWWELRDLGHPWLVTDLITIGSPLAHAAMLLAADEADLRRRQRQRELPTNPPIPEGDGTYAFKVWKPYRTNAGGTCTLRALHHGALFAATRWSNLYFPTRASVFGDLVGGSIATWFGPGVRDLAVSTGGWRDRTPAAHVGYWRLPKKADATAATALGYDLTDSIECLIAVLDGDCTHTLRTHVPRSEGGDGPERGEGVP